MRNSLKNNDISFGDGLGLEFDITTDERVAVLEMLLWKYHTEAIPVDVVNRLVLNKFMVKCGSDSYRWTKLSDDIGSKFNKKFNYNEKQCIIW